MTDILNKLKDCNWYWEGVAQSDAETILNLAKEGSFILRDSTDPCHLFTISLKAKRMVISVRITHSKGLFKLDACTPNMPSFYSVVDLVEHYLSNADEYFFVEVDTITGVKEEVPVRLRYPYIKEVLSLQHLCRIRIVRLWKSQTELESLPLPLRLKKYLSEFSHSPPS